MEYQRENCGYCGACVTVCPKQILELTENEITVANGCDECGNCTVVCPLGALTLGFGDEYDLTLEGRP